MVLSRIGLTSKIAALLFLLPCCILAENLVSRPVGFVRVSIPSNSTQMFALPLSPFDPAVSNLLSGQLTSGKSEVDADRIFKWDAAIQTYEKAVFIDETWWSDFTGGIRSTMTLNPGEGFWVENRQGTNQTILMIGKVPMDMTNAARVFPGLNAVGAPYPATLDRTNGGLARVSGVLAVASNASVEAESMSPGRGYWLVLPPTNVTIWSEVRPYPDYSSVGSLPTITELSVDSIRTNINLRIACSGVREESVVVMTQDVPDGHSFDAARGWRLASDVIRTEGMTSFVWTDEGAVERLHPSCVFSRYYMVGRHDIDRNTNGISDVVEVLTMSRPGLLSEGALDHHLEAPVSSNSVGGSNEVTGQSCDLVATNSLRRSITVRSVKIIYVDARIGDDALSGRTPMVSVPEGPRRTVRGGVKIVEPDDIMIIKEGHYSENLNLMGRSVSVFVQGNVKMGPVNEQNIANVTVRPEDSVASNGLYRTGN